ncbi:hypothetical protein HPG69_002725 [Diceros bicornis minor]|uniref:Uncharacterized protein n=1 Tax=Diceros bicornis minor TaxID=77932 RepID=A0A7J7FLW5_DICBM|nr:hypothetical protein HPG69_002725 [Diceros bicornis minor]
MLMNMQTHSQTITYGGCISQVSDTTVNELVILILGVVVVTLSFICILVSYGRIGATILRVPSTKGICKALSTCGSHLSVVLQLLYGKAFPFSR